jgi:hypothetical protein
MRQMILTIVFVLVYCMSCMALNLPELPATGEIETLVVRPQEEGNAADQYLKAEKILRDKQAGESKQDPQTLLLDEGSEEFKLVLEGLKCRRCVFPYSLDITVPPYETMIPMMLLYNTACRTFRAKGDTALKSKQYDQARDWYSKAVNLGLHIFEDPAITIIQDLISTKCIAVGIEGLGDLFIAQGETGKAEICRRFLTQKTEFSDRLSRFMRTTLSRPGKMSDEFREAAVVFPTIKYTSIKLEILIFASELHILSDNPEIRSLCAKIIADAKIDPDVRIRKVALWGDTLKREELLKATESTDMGIPD